ncbi:MAG: Uma2 family endonuclease [Cyanobacteria bacterium SID2]|nr:Uma2 family endonuclease [Cyanobacteria bacterium SID2]MBP0005393.1 Uma2 family endonuclease [Cyanobacteria bacterium SBC]
MSPELAEEQFPQTSELDVWEPPMPPTDLIFDDGEPLESNRHRIGMNLLIESAEVALADRTDYFVGGNMFIYYSSAQAKNQDFRGPDFFAVLGVEENFDRQGWVVWEENGRYPDVIVELMSPSTAKVDVNEKKRIYEQIFRTPDYFVFDPFDRDSLRGWHLDVDRGYQELEPNDRGWLWCSRLNLWLGTWDGTILRNEAFWLRFYDPEGNLVLRPNEKAIQEAEVAKQQAETARQRAEEERQRAEEERERAEEERERAEEERERADRLAAKLRELGLDPNNLD